MRFSKKKLGLIMVAGLAVLMVMTSAPAAVTGGGVVSGNVTITQPTSGIPLTGACVVTKYNFASVVLSGIFANGTKYYAGQIKTSGVNGGSSCETLNGASGNVNSAGAPATFTGSTAGKTVSGKFYGTYKRTSALVQVKLSVVQAKLNGVSVPNFQVRLDFSLFIPTTVSTSGVKKASFVGEFHTGTV